MKVIHEVGDRVRIMATGPKPSDSGITNSRRSEMKTRSNGDIVQPYKRARNIVFELTDEDESENTREIREAMEDAFGEDEQA